MPHTCGGVSRADSGGLGTSDAESVIAMFSTLERRCRPRPHLRPCESRDPYAAAVVLSGAGRRLFHNNRGLWLWVPAFAGTTVIAIFSILERRCRPQPHRRPCERRDPYAAAVVLSGAGRRLFHTNRGL